MGSGTTVGEALKLGARAIGRDLNPVAHFAVRNALAVHSRRKVLATFQEIAADLAPTLRQYYQARWPQEGSVEVLYYFWVKTVPCPGCRFSVDLFSTRIFTRHADSQRHPEARSVCPHCGAIETVHYADHTVCCSVCQNEYAPQEGPARGAQAHCPVCGHTFPMAKTIKASGRPPDHRLYAKMVLLPDGHKEYLPTDDYDRALYEEAGQSLARRAEAYPVVPIAPGYNTNQLLNYGYTHWHQLFNDRQLLCLSLLAERIRAIPEENLRALFACLFSGCLEFNNMLASYKGEGTGAVRHAFAHHILKPERTPLEANLWGTPKSSGAFSTLFQSRLLRALDYAEEPFELRVIRRNGRPAGERVYGLNVPLGHDIADTFAAFQEGRSLYLSCGDSAQTDLADASVDVVITDPPFFDNVHYSELADFFFVWQRHLLGPNGNHNLLTTRSPAEVQQRDAETFTEKLSGVWTECHRVLRPGGLLIFTYHHSRPEGWQSVLKALVTAGWVITAAHPIKAEMSVAAPKQQAAEPIDLDVILVCRRRLDVAESPSDLATVIDESARAAEHQIARFNRVGRALSRNDVRVILTAQVIARLSYCPDLAETVPFLEARQTAIEREIDRLHHRCWPLHDLQADLSPT
jgi:adenine-specific DNA methylase